jgi:predicted nucleic acid-binding protein
VIVLDTNVVSELMRPSPARAVVGWSLSQDARDLFTTSVTLAEIRYGIERLPDGQRKAQLRAKAADIFFALTDKVLPFDGRAALRYATLAADRDRAGLPIAGFDAQIAAVCRTYNAALATRNVKDFQHTGVELINPWQQAGSPPG